MPLSCSFLRIDWVTLYRNLENLMSLDPLVLYGILDVCPEKELPKLFSIILPYFSISFMASQQKMRKAITAEQVYG